MNTETPETAVDTTKVEPQVPAKVIAPKSPKVAKAPKAKSKQAKAKKPATKAKAKNAKPAKVSKAKKTTAPKAKTAKAKKTVPQGKFPRHPKNPFREGSAYAQIFDAFATKDGVRRDELLQLAMDATGKDVKHAAYDLAVIRSAKESSTGPRHPSCREGFWVKRENECFTLMIG